jgi:phage terminase large subunit-like protein
VALGLQYARDVVAGNIPACEYVRQACHRHLDDLKKFDEDVRSPYRFEGHRAELACVFATRFRHIKGPHAGRNIELAAWQCFVLMVVFGWIRRDNDKRRFRRVYIEVPRGNGKTTLSAAPALFAISFVRTSRPTT